MLCCGFALNSVTVDIFAASWNQNYELANCILKRQFKTSILKIRTTLIWNYVAAVSFDLLQLYPRPKVRIRSVPGNKTPPLIISPMMHPTDQMSTENKMQ